MQDALLQFLLSSVKIKDNVSAVNELVPSRQDQPQISYFVQHNSTVWYNTDQRSSQEFDLGGYKWVKETKQPHKKFKVDSFWGEGIIYRYTPPPSLRP